jgi:hypothetical protein
MKKLLNEEKMKKQKKKKRMVERRNTLGMGAAAPRASSHCRWLGLE